jgi:hypothetical protein
MGCFVLAWKSSIQFFMLMADRGLVYLSRNNSEVPLAVPKRLLVSWLKIQKRSRVTIDVTGITGIFGDCCLFRCSRLPNCGIRLELSPLDADDESVPTADFEFYGLTGKSLLFQRLSTMSSPD